MGNPWLLCVRRLRGPAALCFCVKREWFGAAATSINQRILTKAVSMSGKVS